MASKFGRQKSLASHLDLCYPKIMTCTLCENSIPAEQAIKFSVCYNNDPGRINNGHICPRCAWHQDREERRQNLRVAMRAGLFYRLRVQIGDRTGKIIGFPTTCMARVRFSDGTVMEYHHTHLRAT